ncbi:MAG: choice-of-anchor tandem repeat GloVer-containing protein [Candidatus Korobacteraceae bacterium]
MRGKSQIPNSIVWAIAWAAAVALLVLLAVATARAQNPVPPTAREAAASPTFAAKLHPSTRPAMNKPRASARARSGRPLPQDGALYDNGPVNGTTDAWTINFGYIVSDSFVADNGNSVSGFDLYVWEFPGDTMSSLQWSITTQPNGGTLLGSGIVSGSSLTDTFISTNQYGYDIDKVSATDLSVTVTSGSTYWFNVQNATVPSGDPVYWDENSGVGCNSPGCPSQAYDSEVGTIASEAFEIGSCVPPSCYPESPCFQSGGNMEIIHEFNSNIDEGSPSGGVVADPAGNVYGPMSGGQTGYGFVYEIAGKNQGWLFNVLYNFTGSSDGANPNSPIVGPAGVLYGTAGGGCCGLVYSLRPAPTPCATSSCPWTESVIYQFADSASAGAIAAFDQAGNLYGFSVSGGAYGKGAVFELSPSPGGWTETILYSFTGGSDGSTPDSLLVGRDGNLYGAGEVGGAYGSGVIFQLVRPVSGDIWAENVIYNFTGQPHNIWWGGSDGGLPGGLVQDGLGSLLGFSHYTYTDPGGYHHPHLVVFMLSPSNGGWAFGVLDDIDLTNMYGAVWSSSGLATDTAGNVYWAYGTISSDGLGLGNVVSLVPGGGLWFGWNQVFLPEGPLALDADRRVYGTTNNCGYGQGTIWKVTQ